MSGKRDRKAGQGGELLAEAFKSIGLEATMWVVKERTPVEVSLADGLVWETENPDGRRVAADVVDDARVSTVFIGMMNFKTTPLPTNACRYFETMVFKGKSAITAARYDTWQEAEDGHARIVDQLRREAEGSAEKHNRR